MLEARSENVGLLWNRNLKRNALKSEFFCLISIINYKPDVVEYAWIQIQKVGGGES